HTLMPEALETWPVVLMERVLPRPMQIIYEINELFLQDVRHRYPGDTDLIRRMSLIDESGVRRVRMAHLAIVGSHRVNGVAALHTELMKHTIFRDFHEYFPNKIINVTNGVTPRRWLNQANPMLSALISERIGRNWLIDLALLKKLAPLAKDKAFRERFASVKRVNKERLAAMVEKRLGLILDPASMFDVHVKRIHEYKRQLLNVLHVITRYNRIRRDPGARIVPRSVIFSGKAAPGYATAKLIIRLINDVADVINNDPAVRGLLKVAFIPNYDVSSATQIIPAADLSEQISTAGTEASGTGNMKLALNGALTIGTLDGANVEMLEEVGKDNMFIFGLTSDEVGKVRANYNPWDYYNSNAELKEVLDMIAAGYFSPDQSHRYQPIFDLLTQHGDHYLLLADYASYVACQEKIDALYSNSVSWMQKAILNVAYMGKFSSDRTIKEYAQHIWETSAVGWD
ncbi:MAG: glycogen/starch/alpha-glucan family phosphorylase, partial [Burkholderiales bacterium]